MQDLRIVNSSVIKELTKISETNTNMKLLIATDVAIEGGGSETLFINVYPTGAALEKLKKMTQKEVLSKNDNVYTGPKKGSTICIRRGTFDYNTNKKDSKTYINLSLHLNGPDDLEYGAAKFSEENTILDTHITNVKVEKIINAREIEISYKSGYGERSYKQNMIVTLASHLNLPNDLKVNDNINVRGDLLLRKLDTESTIIIHVDSKKGITKAPSIQKKSKEADSKDEKKSQQEQTTQPSKESPAEQQTQEEQFLGFSTPPDFFDDDTFTV